MQKFLILIIIVTMVFAENNAVDFLETGLSAKGLALGNACTALPGYSDAVFFNPAAIVGNSEKIKISSSAVNNFEEVERKNIGCLIPAGEEQAYALNFSNSFVGNILKTRWTGERPEVTDKFSSEQYNITLTYSRKQDQFLAYGFNLRKYTYLLDNYYANAFGLDCGILYKIPENILDTPVLLGAAWHNLGRTNVAWSTGHNDTMPMRLNLSASIYRNIFNRKLMLAAEIEKEEINKPLWRLGAEYWLVNNMIGLRAGYDLNKIAYGLGLQYQGLGIDYGQTEYTDLGLIKRITLSYSF